MNSEHPIDDLFRKELENREPEFREEYWKEAEQVLDQHPQTSARNSWWKWFGAIIIVASVAGLTGYYFGMNHSSLQEVKEEEVAKENNSTESFSNISSEKGQHETAVMDSGIGMTDTTINSSVTQTSTSSGFSNSAAAAAGKNSSASSSSNIPLEKTTAENTNVVNESGDQINHSVKSGQVKSAQTESKKNLRTIQSNSTSDESKTLREQEKSAKTGSTQSEKTPEDHSLVPENSPQENSSVNASFMKPLSFQEEKLSFNSPAPSQISFSPSLGIKHHSSLQSLEFSLDGGGTLITVPSTNSTAWGYEWQGLLQYRVNKFSVGSGVGQFSVKDYFTASSQSIIDSTASILTAIFDTTIVIDSILIDSNIINPIYIYDTTYHITSDTSYQLVTTHDTITTKKKYTSSGHYLELPVMFSYCFYGLGLRWQLSAGASYAWYSGGLRYAVDSADQVISYKPGSVISILGRLYAQYPLSRKFYLQGYTGARYVIGLKSDHPARNYLIYSLGLGLLYTF